MSGNAIRSPAQTDPGGFGEGAATGVAGCLPKGFRDLYWCWLVNEPGIVKYMDDIQCCGVCGGPVLEMPAEHTFICHIEKPRATP